MRGLSDELILAELGTAPRRGTPSRSPSTAAVRPLSAELIPQLDLLHDKEVAADLTEVRASSGSHFPIGAVRR